ncbi:MAG: antibiotic biosynthesis monooxygenase [Burkholderiaceae bacterium]|nr:antibiotic biosynthesis monooxygenase [Burkholderiaceae bacterium]
MILEVVDIRIDESKQDEFNEAILRGVRTAIAPAKGFRGFKVNHSIESPNRYLLMIYWDTLEKLIAVFKTALAQIQA